MPVDSHVISQLALLCDLPPALLQVVAEAAQAKRFPALHSVLMHHTTPAFLTVVLRGQLQKTEVSDDGRITGVGFCNPGDVLEWLSVVDGAALTFSVSTTVETDLLLIPIAIARRLLNECPALANRAMQQLAAEVRQNTMQRQLLTLPNAHQRIFVQIIQLAEQSPGKADANLPKQHEIAAMVNTSRETVSRTIQMLVKQGILVKHGHRFVLQRPDQLKQLATNGAPSSSAYGKPDPVVKA